MLFLQKHFSLRFFSTAVSLHLQNLGGDAKALLETWGTLRSDTPPGPEPPPSAGTGAIAVRCRRSSPRTLPVGLKQLPPYTSADKPALLAATMVSAQDPQKEEQTPHRL